MRNNVVEIEKLFLRDCIEEISVKDKESLHVAIRIAADFYAYLRGKEQDQYPSVEDGDTSYIIGTLRSGFDYFFDIFQLNSILDERVARQLSLNEIRTFDLFRRKYLESFEYLWKFDLSPQMRFGHLVVLGKMHFIFIGMTLI